MNRIFCILIMFVSAVTGYASGQKDDATREAIRLYEISGKYYDEQKYDSAVITGEQALPLLRKKNLTDELTDELSILAVCCSRQSDYDKALRYAKECNAMDRASGDKEMISSSLNTIGAIYMDLKQPKEALTYILEALKLAEEINHRARIAIYCGAAAETELSMNHFDAANKYIDRAIELEREDGRDLKLRVRLAQKAAILIGMKKKQQALEIFDSIIPFFRNAGNRQSLAISLNKAGHILLDMSKAKDVNENIRKQQVQKAVAYFREGASLCREMGNPYNELQARNGLYKALWTLNPDSAQRELEIFNQLKDSLYNSKSSELLAKYNAEFGNDLLMDENTSVKRSRVYIFIISAVLLLVAIVVVVRQRQLAVLQRQRLGEVTMSLDELRQRYERLACQHNAETDGNGQVQTELSAQDKDFLLQTMNIITEQIESNNVNVDELAQEMAMSPSQFRRRLIAVTGETPQTYITNIRMQKARYLLDTQPELPILNIAMHCGYDEQSNFTRAFKRFFGVTPREYLLEKH